MEKYNLIKELLERLPKIKVGDKIVRHLEIPKTNGVFEDRKVLDIVQDKAGNLLGIRVDTFAKNGDKLSTEKIATTIKSHTNYDRVSGTRVVRWYNDNTVHDIMYNHSGTKPI